MAVKFFVAASIRCRMRGFTVLTPVNLNSGVKRRTIEVQYVWPGGMLSPEARSFDLCGTQPRPDLALAVRRPAPQ